MNYQLAGIMAWYERESKASQRMLKAIPDDKLNKKIYPKFRTAGEIGMHLGDSLIDLMEAIKTGKLVIRKTSPVLSTGQAILNYYQNISEELISEAKNFTDAHVTRKFDFAINGKVVWIPTGLELLSAYICHEIHHRAQIGVVLRLMDVKIPGMYGPSADER